MTPVSLRLTLWSVAFCLLPIVAAAQPADTSDQQLPEIAPREIEIRGELQLSFPSLERQPLRGFASPPTIPSVPSNRTPYAEPYKQELEALPESLPSPDLASPSVGPPASPDRGFVQMGGGRYGARFAEARYTVPFTPRRTLSLHADYFGTQGFSPFSGLDVQTPSDRADGQVRFESRHPGFALAADVHGAADWYTLYGRPALATTPDASAPDRSGLTGGLTAEIHTYGPVASTIEATVDRTAYETESLAGGTGTVAFAETRLGLAGQASFPVGGVTAEADGQVYRSTYGGDVPSSSGTAAGGGAHVQVLSTDQASVRIGGRAMGFSVPRDPETAPASSKSAFFVAPAGRAELTLGPGVSLFARTAPSLETEGLASFYARSPYAEHAPPRRPTLYTTDAHAGLRLSVGTVQFRTLGGMRYAPSYQYFFSPLTAGSALADAPIRVAAGSARILRGGGQIALQGVDGVEASVEAFVRDGALVGPDTPIPYFAPLAAEAMVSVAFADRRGLLQATGSFESARRVAPAADKEVDAVLAVDLTGSYQITPLLDAVLKVHDLSPDAPTTWARYPRAPTTLTAGFRIHW